MTISSGLSTGVRDAAGRRWSLRIAESGDRLRLRAWRNDPSLRAVMTHDAPIGAAQHDAWFAASVSGGDRELLIFTLDDEPIGTMQLTDIDRAARRARWGFYLGPDGAPPRSGTRMGWLALERAFAGHGFHRVGAEVLDVNERSLRMHRRLGFRDEGTLRAYLRRAERWHDLVLFGILSEEWDGVRGTLREALFG